MKVGDKVAVSNPDSAWYGESGEIISELPTADPGNRLFRIWLKSLNVCFFENELKII